MRKTTHPCKESLQQLAAGLPTIIFVLAAEEIQFGEGSYSERHDEGMKKENEEKEPGEWSQGIFQASVHRSAGT